MAELRLYHGRPNGVEPPSQLLTEAIETASKNTSSPAFCAGEVVHHAQVEHWRADFGTDTGGESVVCLCDPDTGSNVPASDVTTATVDAIETELRNRLGAGVLAVMRVGSAYRTDSDGQPRALPEALSTDG
jgi:hypothetical protein